MVAVEAASEQGPPRDRDARAKAAAWAWYQRHGASIPPGSGRSEAFATRCATCPTPSRFQREATMPALDRVLTRASSDAAVTSSSLMDKLSGSSSSLSHCDLDSMYGNGMDRDALPLNRDTLPQADQESDAEQPSLDLISMDPAAHWDCGSSLFDSFELVAMSKKLDAELDEPNIDGHELEMSGVGFDLNQHKLLALCDAPGHGVEAASFSSLHAESHDAHDIFDKLITSSAKQSKQAVYDMFCHYGDAAKLVAKQTSKGAASPASTACGRHQTRKHKFKSGRMSLHGLAKALHSISHLHSNNTQHSSGEGDDATNDGQDDSHHHHHHHLHCSPVHSQSSGGKALQSPAGVSPLVERHTHDDVIDGPKRKSRHIHHHHHHHYHYLFHSDDDFRFQPLDKSMMVAAAGLRSSKANVPALSSYLGSPSRGDFPMDLGRKHWAEIGSMPSTNLQY